MQRRPLRHRRPPGAGPPDDLQPRLLRHQPGIVRVLRREALQRRGNRLRLQWREQCRGRRPRRLPRDVLDHRGRVENAGGEIAREAQIRPARRHLAPGRGGRVGRGRRRRQILGPIARPRQRLRRARVERRGQLRRPRAPRLGPERRIVAQREELPDRRRLGRGQRRQLRRHGVPERRRLGRQRRRCLRRRDPPARARPRAPSAPGPVPPGRRSSMREARSSPGRSVSIACLPRSKCLDFPGS